MDELFQLILFAAFILFGLMSAFKKKKPGTPQRTSMPVQRPGRAEWQPDDGASRVQTLETTARTPVGPPERTPAGSTVEQPERTSVTRMEELFELLQQRVEQPEIEERPPEPEVYVAAEPVQMPEPPSSPARDVVPPVSQRTQPRKRSRANVLNLNAKTARQGIILAEILGQPKGLSE